MRYASQNQLADIVLTTDAVGTVVARVRYFAFGVRRNSTGNLDTDKKFTGQRLDQTGLYFYNSRYHDATIGQFISPDMVPDYRNPQSLSLHAYYGGNLLARVDPTGLSWWNSLRWKITKAVAEVVKPVVQVFAGAAAIAVGTVGMVVGRAAIVGGAVAGGVAGACAGAIVGIPFITGGWDFVTIGVSWCSFGAIDLPALPFGLGLW
ncbi:MAG: RHS repeat-associated core domain-containing protein [Chloroflexi bacterium]|nr:RHS repeat-associated core domain-containing protein [Chloroflexota bacterium]